MCTAVLLAWSAPVWSTGALSFDALAPEKRVDLKADSMFYDQKTNLYSAEGNVIVEQEGSV